MSYFKKNEGVFFISDAFIFLGVFRYLTKCLHDTKGFRKRL